MKSSGTKPNGSTRDLMNDGLTVQQEQRTGFNTFLLCSYHHLQDSHWLHNHCHIGFIFTEINLWEECTLHDPISYFETQSVCLFTFAVWPVVLLLSPSKYTSRSESLWKLRLDEPFSKIPHDIFKSEKSGLYLWHLVCLMQKMSSNTFYFHTREVLCKCVTMNQK